MFLFCIITASRLVSLIDFAICQRLMPNLISNFVQGSKPLLRTSNQPVSTRQLFPSNKEPISISCIYDQIMVVFSSHGISLPTQLCLFFYYFWANLLHSFIIWLIVVSLSLYSWHILFYISLVLLAFGYEIVLGHYNRGTCLLFKWPLLTMYIMSNLKYFLIGLFKWPCNCLYHILELPHLLFVLSTALLQLSTVIISFTALFMAPSLW